MVCSRREDRLEPDVERIESLLGRRDESSQSRSQIKPLQELTQEEKQRTGLVSRGTKCTHIPGDPFGMLMSWAGNVAHPTDDRIYDIMEPILDELLAASINDTPTTRRIQALLELIPLKPFGDIVDILSVRKTYSVLRDNPQETVVDFELAPGLPVRLMHCKDIDVNDGTSYLRASRARQFEAQRAAQLDDPPMTRELTQFMMAYELTTINAFTNNQDEVTVGKRSRNDMYYTDYSDYGGSLYALREAAQERYWYHMSPEERKRARDESSRSPKFEFSSNLVAIRQGWQKEWDNAALHPDHFRNNHMDNLAAENVWNLVEGLGIFVAIDVNRQVIFADVERLFKTLWDQELLIVLIRCFDMWAYFTPLPAPEPCGLAAENYFLKVHPELDMSKASVEKLPNARSCVAHYGCLASSNDTEGQRIFTTLDTRCSRDDCMAYSADIFPRFAEAALGKATEMIRFLMKPLDRAFYEESLQIHSDLDSEEKITTSDEDFLNHFTLGVNGYVGRHRNIKGCTGGLTGICSFGDYLEGGHLCVPALGIKVWHGTGACVLVRGTSLEYLVEDYEEGFEIFVVGSTHESTRKYSRRKRGLLRSRPFRQSTRTETASG